MNSWTEAEATRTGDGVRRFSTTGRPLGANRATRSEPDRPEWIISALPPLLALVPWSLSLSHIDLKRIPDVGLVANLPTGYFLALGVLILSFAWLMLRSPRVRWPWVLHVIVLIVILHGTLALIYEVPRFGWTYKHIGLTGYIQLHGAVNPLIDAYHNWPGFFALAALLTELLRLPDALDYARWAQPFFNLLYLGPLVLIFSSLVSDRRVVWLAVWVFYLTNWISQDYFAPQAFGYLLYLLAVGIVLRWFGRPPPQNRFVWRPFAYLSGLAAAGDPTPPMAQGRLRLALVAMLVLVFGVVASSHQLTPFMLISALAALALSRRSAMPLLVIALAAITLVWNTTMARDYFQGQTAWKDSIGHFLSNFQSLPDTLAQTPGRTLVGRVMRAFVLTVWGLAALGFLRRLRLARLPIRATLLALSPFPMVLLGSYGGEIMLRIYFFSLPFVAFLAALAFAPTPESLRTRRSTAAVAAVSAVLALGFLTTYLAKEQQNHIEKYNVEILGDLYRLAPPRSIIVALSDSCCMPFRLAGNYDTLEHINLVDDRNDREREIGESDLRSITDQLRRERRPAAYFVFSKTLAVYFSGNNILRRGNYQRLERLVQASGWRVVLENSDATIYALGRSGSDVP